MNDWLEDWLYDAKDWFVENWPILVIVAAILFLCFGVYEVNQQSNAEMKQSKECLDRGGHPVWTGGQFSSYVGCEEKKQ